ncbi:ABC transporter substrate-binding protein [Paenibacillus sp. P96]|uniref:Thiamine pyrimidine synthase n=1 Tax=Paenibacillus zeirhizosphaerae TaxID=2987519 RepID=A0ABT9FXD0_9BACL|nr:ABC transporter substrate-binding protein [Paenibacillus sp. P96]MDP4099294.1 ABC transporter substrate-binding protein [Paenibacillus sp. P96]
MKNKRKYARGSLAAAMVLLLVSVLAGCGSGESAGEEGAAEGTDGGGAVAEVRLQLKWVPQAQFAGYFVAQEQGFYEEEGLAVDIIPGGPDIVPEQQVANGAATIGVDWVASLLAHQEQGLPLVEIAQVFQKSGLVLVSKKEAGIDTAAALKGKKVGNWMGGNEFEVLALFDKYGLDPNTDLEFTKQGFTMDQLLSGEMDAASAMTYNEYQIVLEQGIPASDLNVIDMNEEGVAMLEDNLFANRDWLEANKETAAKFVRASLKGWQYAIDNPEEAVDMVMKQTEDGSTSRDHQLKMLEEVAKLILPEGMDKADIGRIDADMFKQTADIAHQFGVITQPADLKNAYTTEILEMAAKQ